MADPLTVLTGDALAQLRTLPDASVHMCATSPPYFGLRDYGTATWEGGDPDCDHSVGGRAQVCRSSLQWSTQTQGHQQEGYRGACGRCGALRVDAQIGTEDTPEAYVARLVEVFREVKRVLRDDGTLWLNLGSSYASASASGKQGKSGQRANRSFTASGCGGRRPSRSPLLARDLACDNGGIGLQGFQADGRACSDCDDGCQGEILSHRERTVRSDRSGSRVEPLTLRIDRDIGQTDCAQASPDALLLDALPSTTRKSFDQPLGVCDHAALVSVSQQGTQTSSPASPPSADRLACNFGIFPMSPPLVFRRMGTESFFSACGRSDCRGIGRCGLCWCSLSIASIGVKTKDLISIPHLVALALQADGWYLRSNIIWAKPGTMPESVTDRCTKSHEHVFLLSKAPRYFFDAEAIKEESVGGHGSGNIERKQRPSQEIVQRGNQAGSVPWTAKPTRNRRDVWTIATKPYPGSHFAVWPEALVQPMILAGTSAKGCCAACGAPWRRILAERERPEPQEYEGKWGEEDGQSSGRRVLSNLKAARDAGADHDHPFPGRATIGWEPTCECGEEKVVPGRVLDPFAGSGTTGAVALKLGRAATLIELNPEYVQLIRSRCQVALGLPGVG